MIAEEWPDSTDVREFFVSHVQAETRLDSERIEAIVQTLLDEGLGTFGVLRDVVREFSNDESASAAKILQTCINPPMPLGVCFVLAKHLQSRKPASPPQLSAMNLLVKATRATDLLNADSSSEEDDYLDNGRELGLPRAADPMNLINVVAAQIKAEPATDGVATIPATGTPPPPSVRHSGTHVCPYCPKRFQYCHLQDHIRSHTGEKPFRCPHCMKFFSRNSTMRRHVKKLHKMPPPESQQVPPHIPPPELVQNTIPE